MRKHIHNPMHNKGIFLNLLIFLTMRLLRLNQKIRRIRSHYMIIDNHHEQWYSLLIQRLLLPLLLPYRTQIDQHIQ